MAKSLYEKMFGMENGPGRPKGSDGDSVAFLSKGRDKKLVRQAKRRAMTILVAKNREELRRYFEAEYAHLAKKQGFEEIEIRVVETKKVEVA